MDDQKPHSVLIIDPCVESVSQVSEVIAHYKDFEVIGVCSNGQEGLQQIQLQRPAIVFLETDLEDMPGFELLQRIYPIEAPVFIFITKNPDHAVRAFEFFAFDYLLKPFKNERLHLTLLKARERFSKGSENAIQEKLNALYRYVSASNTEGKTPEPSNGKHLLPVKVGGRIYFIRDEEIQYIIASGYYIEIFANGKKHLLRQSLRGIIHRLDSSKFLRIHRSVIISLKYLKEISRQGANEFNAKMEDGASFKISKSYKSDVFEQIGIG